MTHNSERLLRSIMRETMYSNPGDISDLDLTAEELAFFFPNQKRNEKPETFRDLLDL